MRSPPITHPGQPGTGPAAPSAGPVGRPAVRPAGVTSRRVVRPAGGKGRCLARTRVARDSAGGGRRPVWSAGEVPNSSPRPGRYPSALPGAGTVFAVDRHRPGLARWAAQTICHGVCVCLCVCMCVLVWMRSVEKKAGGIIGVTLKLSDLTKVPKD